MENEFVTIRHDRLMEAATLLPTAQRTAFLATLLVGREGVLTALAPALGFEVEERGDGPQSYPITVEQAREMRSKIDDGTWALIKEAVSNAKDDVATVDWSDAKRITGVANWAQFAKGRLAGLHRSLRKLDGVPSGAVLMWWDEDSWTEDGKGDYSHGLLGIDGPAVRSLQVACGIKAGE